MADENVPRETPAQKPLQLVVPEHEKSVNAEELEELAATTFYGLRALIKRGGKAEFVRKVFEMVIEEL